MPDEQLLDCLVIGGGVAGLMSAVYLKRYRRNVLVVDAGKSRLRLIPRTRNVIGFPDGIPGTELWDRIREHAARYGAEVAHGCIDRLERAGDGTFDAWSGEQHWRARYVILATGASDVAPEIGGLDAALQGGQLRYCPVCDGFETQGQRVAVLGRAGHGLRESLFVAGFGNEVTWLAMQTQDEVAPEDLARLRECGVRIAEQYPRHIHCTPGQGVEVELQGGTRLAFDVIYPALGLTHVSELALALGAQAQADGQLKVDAHQQTTVPGLYAAGDVSVDLNQISVAAAHAAIAATAIHNSLL
ncbi:NAD(P)/FAD-dependent oxidoreductase [Ramlibacter albus]|uniref:NAD(P)/FAD-dependent oxidoreductase n=1 Tax=Ramlibacter albus TaxID=2079448 RepID=A0A923S330_9BURK|nr:NAD(P)/FAD-dependent oxidoreductase [Ramlibacter albus]